MVPTPPKPRSLPPTRIGLQDAAQGLSERAQPGEIPRRSLGAEAGFGTPLLEIVWARQKIF